MLAGEVARLPAEVVLPAGEAVTWPARQLVAFLVVHPSMTFPAVPLAAFLGLHVPSLAHATLHSMPRGHVACPRGPAPVPRCKGSRWLTI